jgi:hypothetical protein
MENLQNQNPLITNVIHQECNWGRTGKLFFLNNQVYFDTSDGEYGPVIFDVKLLIQAFKKHQKLILSHTKTKL